MPRHFYDFPALFKASEKCCFRTLSCSKAKHVAMETYHELIQLYRKLLPLIKFLEFMLLNISLPHHRVMETAPAQLNETFIADLQSARCDEEQHLHTLPSLRYLFKHCGVVFVN